MASTDTGRDFIGLPLESFTIADYHPTADPKDSKATQVHLILDVGPARFIIRFKSGVGLDNFITDMQQHRRDVFG